MMEPVVLPPEKAPLAEEEIGNVKPWALTGHKEKRERNAINSVWLQQELLEEYIEEYWPKYVKAENELQDWEAINVENCETLFVAYGSVSRVVKEAMADLEKEGHNVGLIRLKTLWPFPHKAFELIGDNCKNVICCELSMGQMMKDVEAEVKGKYPVHLINRVGGMLLDPVEVVERTKKILEVK
jgi:2-oxoglutarate ferredoxin oxidoreductase subunit alpha